MRKLQQKSRTVIPQLMRNQQFSLLSKLDSCFRRNERRILVLWAFLLLSALCFSQETEYKEHSYTEFFELIKQETDSIFRLSDAIIRYNSETDQRFRATIIPNEKTDPDYQHLNDIVIDKHLRLNNVQFVFDVSDSNYFEGVLFDIHFKKSVELKNVGNVLAKYCRFENTFRQSISNCEVISGNPSNFSHLVYLLFCDFSDFRFSNNCRASSNSVVTNIEQNRFYSDDISDIFSVNARNTMYFIFVGNTIDYKHHVLIDFSDIQGLLRVIDNDFTSDFIRITKTNQDNRLNWSENTFSSPVFLEVDPFSPGDKLGWKQFENGFYSYNAFTNYTLRTVDRYPVHLQPDQRNELVQKYKDSIRLYDENSFVEEISIKSHFYSHFRRTYNTRIANQVYIDLKDFETRRLEIEHDQNPGFRSFFKWKVNQFLKLFSDYGTEPAKAIVFSVYVILFFALIYLFFPNSWDKHGHKRIVDRYTFFLKYMDKKAGIHEVYLEEKKEELLEFEEFKDIINAKEKRVPKIFTATALPLYKWAVFGTRLSAAILKRIDIISGTWEELPASKRIWKSVLLVAAFTIAIIYDLCIKVLNALMLSINTFTTLGFGEIPIKGLPRYLAIIQGFIGWFMLTIFSVSLISQLLN